MSVEAMSQCWGPRLPVKNSLELRESTIRLVALAVADVGNDIHDNEFYGSVTKLAKKVGLSRETVGLVLRHLCDTKVLAVVQTRPGGTTKYRWMGVSDVPTGSYPQPDDHSVTYLTTTPTGGDDHSVTNPIEPKSEPQEKPSVPPSGPLPTTTFGGEEKDTPGRPKRKRGREVLPDEGGKPPSVRVSDVFDLFVLEWQKVATERKELAMVQVYATKQACYTWLRNKFLAPEHGDPWSPEDVYRLVQEFIREVRYGAITPKPGVSAWQMFQSSYVKLIPRVRGYTPEEGSEVSENYLRMQAESYAALGLTPPETVR